MGGGYAVSDNITQVSDSVSQYINHGQPDDPDTARELGNAIVVLADESIRSRNDIAVIKNQLSLIADALEAVDAQSKKNGIALQGDDGLGFTGIIRELRGMKSTMKNVDDNMHHMQRQLEQLANDQKKTTAILVAVVAILLVLIASLIGVAVWVT